MRGLLQIPAPAELQEAMSELQQPRDQILPVEKIVLWSQWARFEPRLAEELVNYIAKNWERILPVEVSNSIRNSSAPWPQSLGLLTEMAFLLVEKKKQMPYRYWQKLIFHNVNLLDFENSTPELYFIGLNPLASKSALTQAEVSAFPYLKWGYIGNEILVNKASAHFFYKITWLDWPTRKRILNKLIRSQRRFTTKDYQDACMGLLTPRQAQLDLNKFKLIKSIGRTKQRQLVRA